MGYSMDGFNFWVRNPNFRLFPEPAEEGPASPWCAVSRPLVEWGDALLERLTYRPEPSRVNYAKYALLDRYVWLYLKSAADHRAETNLDNHPCSHQGLILTWEKLEDLKFAAGVPELETPERLPEPARNAGVDLEPAREVFNEIMIGKRRVS